MNYPNVSYGPEQLFYFKYLRKGKLNINPLSFSTWVKAYRTLYKVIIIVNKNFTTRPRKRDLCWINICN